MAVPEGKRWTFEFIRRPEAFSSIVSDWKRLVALSGNPLLTYEWFISCVEALHPGTQLMVIAVKRGGEIAAIAPLVLSRKRGGARLEFLGVSSLFEPCGFLFDDNDSLAALVSALIGTGYPAVLQRVPESVSEEILRNAWAGAVCMRTPSASTPFVEIGAHWDEYLGGLSQKRRYDLRRARKRAQELGPISIRIFCPEPGELQGWLEKVFATEASGWKGRNGSAILKKRYLKDFFSAYLERACREGILRLCLLEIGGKTAAAQIALEYEKRFWVLKIGYDEQFARCSPGILLTMETLRYAFGNGLESYEFLGSAEPWIDAWTTEQRPHGNFFIYPFSARGFMGLAADVPRLLFKRLAAAGQSFWQDDARSGPKA